VRCQPLGPATSLISSDVDPVTAFTMVSGAIQGVKKLCALVREAKEAGQEVADLTGQVTGLVGKVLEGTDKLKQAEREVQVNPPKGKSRQVLAFEEVSRKLELKRQYEALRNMIIYELGLPGGFWADFEATLIRMEQEDEDAKRQLERDRMQVEWQRRENLQALWEAVATGVVILLAAIYLAGLLWAIRLHLVNQLWLPWG